MTTPTPARSFADPAPADCLERAASALAENGFTVEILDDAAAARIRIKDLIPAGASVLTGASETLRLSGIEEDINTSGRYAALRPRLLTMDRVAAADEFRRLLASPDVIVASAAAITESGSVVVASGSGSQLPAFAGGAAHAIWIVGAQKVVPDLSTALQRVEEHALPLESARTKVAYGWPSAVNRLLVQNAEHQPGRGTVLLLREAIGFRAWIHRPGDPGRGAFGSAPDKMPSGRRARPPGRGPRAGTAGGPASDGGEFRLCRDHQDLAAATMRSAAPGRPIQCVCR